MKLLQATGKCETVQVEIEDLKLLDYINFDWTEVLKVTRRNNSFYFIPQLLIFLGR